MEKSMISQFMEIQDRYKNENTIGDMLEMYDYYDDYDDDKIIFIYRLVGIKIDGSDDIIDITASSQTEAEIIIESFHDGGYILEGLKKRN